MRVFLVRGLGFLLFLCPSCVFAQWTHQTFDLESGWNAIYLEIEPFPLECDLLLAGLPVQSVWSHDQRFSPVQFILDPDELTPERSDWRVYFPLDSPRSFLRTLFALEAGKAYLVEAAEPFQLTVKGRPRVRRRSWNPDAYHLVGFGVDPASPPTFASWFAASAAHQPLDIWTLGAGGNWEKILNPAATTIESGRAYWVKCHESSEFQGPVTVRLTEGRDLNYERSLVEHVIEIGRPGSSEKNITIEVIPSESVPEAPPPLAGVELPPLAGDVPLTHRSYVTAPTPTVAYLDLPAELVFTSTDRVSKQLRLAVERSRMAPAASDARYQSILVIKDGVGFRRLIGVISQGRKPDLAVQKLVYKSLLSQPEVAPQAGLWLGTVILDKVSEPNLPGVLTPAPAEFSFPLLLHVDATGTVRLLNEVTQLWRPGTYTPDPQNPDYQVVDEPGRYILMTRTAPQSLRDEVGITVQASTLRDGRPFARRISTPMFFLNDAEGNPEEPVMALTGTLGEGGSRLEVALVIDNSDPLNPFHHKYHPRHRFPGTGENVSAENDYTVTRQLTLEFASDPPDGLILAGWGDTHFGGTYTETLIGLAPDPLTVQGDFRIQRISTVPVLNDGL